MFEKWENIGTYTWYETITLVTSTKIVHNYKVQ